MSELSTLPVTPGHRRRARERRPRWQRTIGYLFLVMAVLLTGGLGFGVWDYYHLNGKLGRIGNIIGNSKSIGPTPKRAVVGAQNWLIMGSDSRACKGCARYGKALVNGGARSDTTILAHLARGATSATLVSIPRDSWVQIPACRMPDGHMSSPTVGKFNEAFSIGGPACTIKTVQSLTHVAIDHFLVIDFEGFTNIVDALGGVRVCLRQPINDPIRYDPATGGHIGSGLVLSAGYHQLRGQQALEFVRSRYAVGDGSDLGRIKDQQAFISATIRKIFGIGLLTDPPKLQGVLDATVRSITVDAGITLNGLANFAESLHGLPPSKVNLLTVPVQYNAPGVPTADVAWDPTLAPELWNSIREDQPLPGTVSHHHSQRSPSPSASPSNGLTIPPGQITVNVLNGTTQNGIAHTVAAQLQQLGYNIGQIGNASTSASKTYVEYGPSRVQSSQTVAAAVNSGVPRHLVSTMGDTVTLVLGPDFTGVHAVTISSASPSPSASPTPTSTASLGIVNAAKDRCAIG